MELPESYGASNEPCCLYCFRSRLLRRGPLLSTHSWLGLVSQKRYSLIVWFFHPWSALRMAGRASKFSIASNKRPAHVGLVV